MSSFNSGIVIGSRLTYAAAKRGDLADALGLVSVKYLTPVTAMLFQVLNHSFVFSWFVSNTPTTFREFRQRV